MEKIIGKYKIKIVQDTDPSDPRGDDNLGTMVCFHGRYNLGDKHDYRARDYDGWDEMEAAIIKRENVGVILPLYLYDHSGLTMNTTGFSCPWDSGQVGFIYISKKKMLEEYGGKIVTAKLKERVKQYLIGEVETYDQFLTGDVYGYQIFEIDEDEEYDIDSCWGFYGEDYCMTEAESIVNHLIEKETVKI